MVTRYRPHALGGVALWSMPWMLLPPPPGYLLVPLLLLLPGLLPYTPLPTSPGLVPYFCDWSNDTSVRKNATKTLRIPQKKSANIVARKRGLALAVVPEDETYFCSPLLAPAAGGAAILGVVIVVQNKRRVQKWRILRETTKDFKNVFFDVSEKKEYTLLRVKLH